MVFSYQRVVNATTAIKLLKAMLNREGNKNAKTGADAEKSVLVRLAECAKSAFPKAWALSRVGHVAAGEVCADCCVLAGLRPSPTAAISRIARAQRGALGKRGHGGRPGRLPRRKQPIRRSQPLCKIAASAAAGECGERVE